MRTHQSSQQWVDHTKQQTWSQRRLLDVAAALELTFFLVAIKRPSKQLQGALIVVLILVLKIIRVLAVHCIHFGSRSAWRSFGYVIQWFKCQVNRSFRNGKSRKWSRTIFDKCPVLRWRHGVPRLRDTSSRTKASTPMFPRLVQLCLLDRIVGYRSLLSRFTLHDESGSIWGSGMRKSLYVVGLIQFINPTRRKLLHDGVKIIRILMRWNRILMHYWHSIQGKRIGSDRNWKFPIGFLGDMSKLPPSWVRVNISCELASNSEGLDPSCKADGMLQRSNLMEQHDWEKGIENRHHSG